MIAKAIGRYCGEALVTEVCVTPKPGLVDMIDNGSHADMDLELFLLSAEAIAPYFERLAGAGAASKGPCRDMLPALRVIGIECEQAMFAATRGVNTHKGAIFSLGLAAAAAGRCAATDKAAITVEDICAVAAQTVQPCRSDFKAPKTSNGLMVYEKTGASGARGEALSGFAAVRKHVLPIIRRCVGGFPANHLLLQALLQLMTEVKDTNVLHRRGEEGLRHMAKAARRCLDHGGALSPGGRAMLGPMNADFIARRISPGGCADILATAIALYNIERMFFGEQEYAIRLGASPRRTGIAVECAQ